MISVSRRRAAARALALSTTLLAPRIALAEEPSGEHVGPEYVFGLGGTFGLETTETKGAARVNPGGAAFFEFGAIPRWLSIEVGASFVKAAVGTEFSAEILFKKPFELRPNVELMIGVGPKAVETIAAVPSTTYFGIAGVADFMIWPHERFGIWIAPGWDLVFRQRAEVSFGLALGPMIRWR